MQPPLLQLPLLQLPDAAKRRPRHRRSILNTDRVLGRSALFGHNIDGHALKLEALPHRVCDLPQPRRG